MRMQVAVAPTGIDRCAIITPRGTSPGQYLLDLSSVGGGRHRQRQCRAQNVIKAWRLSMLKASEESPSDRVKLTVTHFISMALKALLPPSEEFRRVERPTDIAALLRASSLPSFPSESLFLLVADITLHPLAKVNQSNEAVWSQDFF